MKRIVFDPAHNHMAGMWAQQRIGNPYPFRDFVAMSLLDGDAMVATVLYCNHSRNNIELHVASDGSKKWMTRAYLRCVFDYPFNHLRVARVTGVVPASNAQALKFDLALGFQVEGRMREAYLDGSDLLILGMLRSECRFLGDRKRMSRHEISDQRLAA